MFAQLFKRGKPHVTVECVAAAQDKGYYGDGLLYLELRGATEATRAIWANIVKRRDERSLTPTNVKLINPGDRTGTISVIPRTKYHMRIKGDRLAMFHHKLDRLHRNYVLGGDDETPPPHFQITLQQKIDIPFLQEWTQTIWKKALELELVEKMDSFGISCYEIKQYANWHQVLTLLYEKGELQLYGPTRSS